MFEFSGVDAVIKNSRLVTNDATTPAILLNNVSGGFEGSLLMENVFFDVSSFDIADWIERDVATTHSTITFKNCTFGVNGSQIKDFSTSLESGAVPLQGDTVDGATTTLTIFGLARNHFSITKARTNSVQQVVVDIVGRDSSDAVQYGGRRLALTKNVAGTMTLEDTQIIGTDFNPLSIGTPPAVAVNTGFSSIEVNCTGKAGSTISWAAVIREVSSVALS